MTIKNPEEQKANPIQEKAKENPKVDVKRRECTLSEDMQRLLLRQLAMELHNMALYKTFANFYAVRGFNKLEKYFNARAQEELNHSFWVNYWLTYNDAEFAYPEIPVITKEWENMEDPFNLTVDAEIATTSDIYEIADLALDEGDYATWNWLNDHNEKTGMLIAEQVEFCPII